MIPSVNSLRFRLFVLVLIALVPALGVTLYTGLKQREAAASGVEQDALRISRLAVSSQQVLIDSTRYLMASLASNPLVLDSESGACHRVLAGLVEQFPDYAILGVAGPQGEVYCASMDIGQTASAAHQPFFKQAFQTGQFVVGDYMFGQDTRMYLPMAYPILAPDSSLQGVLIAVLNMAWLDRVMEEANLPERSAILVLDQDGTVITRLPDPDGWAGKNLREETVVASILERHDSGTLQAIGLDGVRRLYAYSPLLASEQTTSYLAIGLSTEIAYAEVNRTLFTNLTILSIVAIFSLLAAWFIGDIFFLQKVKTLVRTTRQLRAGDLSARTGLQYGSGELEQLAESFDRMAATMEQRQSQLRQAETRFRSLVEQIPAVTYTSSLGSNAHNLYISPQVEAVLGYTPQEWVSDPNLWINCIDAADRDRVLDEIDRSILSRAPFQSEYRFHHKDGHLMWIRDEATFVYDNERPLFMQGLMVDITENKRVEASLRSYAAQLEESNHELQDFAYITSHDLQEPLRKIQAFGERLDSHYNQVLDERGRFYISRMTDSAARMQRLINDLLTYSRVTTRGRPFVETDLAKVAREVVIDLETRLHDTRGRVEIQNLGIIEADPVQMRQLFQNLIGNSLKFHQPETPPVVKIWSQPYHPDDSNQDGMIQLYVKDNGIGFDEKYLDRIFLPFQRLHGRGEYEGSGIGLAICRKIVSRHTGSITAASTPGEGTTFIVTLPVKQISDKDDKTNE